MNPAQALESHGVTVESVFVPFSRSRDKDEERVTLNWRVTVKVRGRDILTTEYCAGIGHAPGYKAATVPHNFRPRRYRSRSSSTPSGWKYRAATPGEALAQYREALAKEEAESGFALEPVPFGNGETFRPKRVRVPGGKTAPVPIEPNALDVMSCLLTDSDVLDSGGFESWASDFGYDPDSRKAESIYRACLETALMLRAGLGGDVMQSLREAFTDY